MGSGLLFPPRRSASISIRDETSALEELLLGVAEKCYRWKGIAERLRARMDQSLWNPKLNNSNNIRV